MKRDGCLKVVNGAKGGRWTVLCLFTGVWLASVSAANRQPLAPFTPCVWPASRLRHWFYNTGDTDFSAQLTNIKALNPDVIFAPGNFTESAALTKQARELGITAPIIGGDTWETQEFIDIGGKAVEGAIFSTFFDAAKPATSETEKFIAEFKKAFPDKEPAGVSALGYDAYLLIIDAIKRANSADPEKIKEAINQTKDFMGASGIVTLDENRNAIKSAVIKQVKNGKFEYLDTVNPTK